MRKYEEYLYATDFNMVDSNMNGQFVKISEINKMIECGAIIINRKS